ncbi:hypothetical protein BCR33DRAFT_851654 [Rhizoclosmatium globosum]|uniref:ABC transporter domain-containing protein n=1 Tax=Rhizoclosmatium globosum TaxID=329046 RepID=A0A1Y2C6D9_9FUNG|nr:hypothetical protein BCR33DRAFT_851654 [Rhizoclosmatium globosum]|eukprot:ORY42612.1 hypothetical protein BCR33DRAFT_851654 [Rhizoclosmatium globosum]
MGGGVELPADNFSLPSNWTSDSTLNFTGYSQSNLPSGAGKGCYIAPNLVLGSAIDSTLSLTCAPGFYCPYLNTSDPSTLPVFCPPSSMCTKYRMFGFPCSPQGLYEPLICKPGYYCPDSHTMLPCPEGHYCPSGTVTPHKCTILTSCPKGSVMQTVYLFLAAAAGIDGFLLLLQWFVQLQHRRKAGIISTNPTHRFHAIYSKLAELETWYTRNIMPVFGHASKSRLKALAQTMMRSSPPRDDTDSRRASSASTLMIEEDIPIPAEEISRETLRHDLTALSRAFQDTFPLHGQVRMNFRFEGMELTLKSGKRVLTGVTGRIREGRMTAILGPSGAGKTTFMNVLMGKVDKTGGKLWINSQESEVHLYRKIIGYVPQEDVMLRELTVRENILHSARVRLPRNWSTKKIQNHVDNVLTTLKLSHVAHTIIGDETERGISGGQRKRVNIGMELAAAPLTIFLDEPTSGLDSTSALEVADVLSSMANLGITIVAVIHQPRIEIFDKFHDVIMIAPGGRVAYMGPVHKVRPYFEALGFHFEDSANVSDVAMDILAGKGVNRVCGGGIGVDEVVELWEDRELRKAFVDGVLAQRRAGGGGGSVGAVEDGKGNGRRSGSMGRMRGVSAGRSGSVGLGGGFGERVVQPVPAVTQALGHGVYGGGAGSASVSMRRDGSQRGEMDEGNWTKQWGEEPNAWSSFDGEAMGLLGNGGDVSWKPPDVTRVRVLSAHITPLTSWGNKERTRSYVSMETPVDVFNRVGSVLSPRRKHTESEHHASGTSNSGTSARSKSIGRSPAIDHSTDIPMQTLDHRGRRVDYNEYKQHDKDRGMSRPRSSFSTLVAAPLLFQSIKNYHNSTTYSMSRTTGNRRAGFDSDSELSGTEANEYGGGGGAVGDGKDSTLSSRAQKRRRSWKRNRDFHNMVPIVVETRGAGFWKQFWYCLKRSFVQQSRLASAFMQEIVVAMGAGVLMGISAQGRLPELYSGAYKDGYAGVSPKPTDVISLYCFLVGLAVALASAPAAVKVFGEEKTVYWREAASGHNRFAYFMAKTVATIPRIIVMSLHFTAVYMILARPVIDPYMQYLIVLLEYWGVYGMSCIISMTVRRENAPLLAVVQCFFAAVFCGYGPSIWQAKSWGIAWMMELSFNKWAAEAMYASSVVPYKEQFNVKLTAEMFGWSTDQVLLDLVMCFGLGLLMRIIAFVLLVFLNRDKQR